MMFKKIAAFAAGALLSLVISTTTAFAANYKVIEGDSLYKISNLFKTTISTLENNNNLKSREIQPGQILKVPAKVYTVKSGDTYYKIAKKNKIKVAAIKKANHKKSNSLLPGKKLILPGIKPASNVTTSKPLASGSVTTNTVISNAVVPYTQKELDLLARLISAEAQGEPYKAMVAVGAVVINRVQSKEWPSSINAVINHVSGGYYQFTPVKNGYIKNPATNDAINAAKSALKGNDPTNGAMFYFDESSTNTWLWSKKIATRIGHMVYVY